MDSTISVVNERGWEREHGNMPACQYAQCISERIHEIFIPLILFKIMMIANKSGWMTFHTFKHSGFCTI